MNKEQKIQVVKAVAAILAFIIMAVAVGYSLYLSFSIYNYINKNAPTVSQPKESGLSMTMQNSTHLKLVGDKGDSTFEKTLVATVLPADAPDKSVSWSVAWESGAALESSNVSSFLTVTPVSTGSSTAIVKCLQAFGNDKIIITCTTNVGGYKATCRVSFIGTPETLSIGTNGMTVGTDTSWNVSMVSVSCGTTSMLPLSLSNSLNSVGSTFGQYTISITPYGGINYSARTFDKNGNETSSTTETTNLQASNAEFYAANGYAYCYFDSPDAEFNIMKVSIDNGQLKIEAQEAISAYSYAHYSRTGDSLGSFASFKDGKQPYVKIIVTETVSGLTQSINVKSLATVSGLNMESSMSF